MVAIKIAFHRGSAILIAAATIVRVFITGILITKLIAWAGGIVEDMCYERRRAEACVDFTICGENSIFYDFSEVKFEPVFFICVRDPRTHTHTRTHSHTQLGSM